MDYVNLFAIVCEYILILWEYMYLVWDYSPWIAYALAFVTLVPKIWQQTRIVADNELRNVKFHRCYGAERCCHPLEDDEVVRPRKKVLRRFAAKRDSTDEKLETAIQAVTAPTLQTHVHVNQIAKMFEGNARKVNRVTPIVTHEQSSDVKKVHSQNESLKSEKTILKNLEERYFRPSPVGKPENIPENDENSADLLNRPLESANIIIQRRRYPSTSPSPPPRPPSRPNSLKASIENIFALASQCTKEGLSPSGPVTSIEEILSQRRLSRPLSAYSISDLLGDSLPDESYIESFFGNLNK